MERFRDSDARGSCEMAFETELKKAPQGKRVREEGLGISN
jgi:hypothetical protein